ncbi:MAG TPA: hypothetical protein VLA24_05155 [Pseudomonadales bacterium]|nr:hypothetical protein [Pseudomonadales bacterium]
MSAIFIEKHVLLDELETAFARAMRQDREHWAVYVRPLDGRLDVLHNSQDREGLVRLIGCWGLSTISDQEGLYAEHPDFDPYGAAELVVLNPRPYLPAVVDDDQPCAGQLIYYVG